MNKGEFITELRSRLARLPHEELEAAVGYYEEYFAEAGEENEERALQELGVPSLIAKQIMADFAIKESEATPSSPKKGVWTIWVIALAILASPIALPLGIVCLTMLLVGVILIGTLVLVGGILVVTFLTTGVAIFALTFKVLFIEPLSALFSLGVSLVLIGFGVLSIMLVYGLVGKVIPLMVKGISNLFERTKKGELR